MKSGVRFLSWQDSDPNSLEWHDIDGSLYEDGYCLIQHISGDRLHLLQLSRACGQIQLHERADAEGVVEVSSGGDSPDNVGRSVFRGLTANLFPPHTDGAYLNTYYAIDSTLREVAPPKLIILQCVRSAVNGGETILVDCQKILRDIKKHDKRLYDDLVRPAALFFRGTNKAVNTPIFSQVHRGKFWVRFRDDVRVKQSLERAMAKLFDSYIQDSEYHVEFKLPDNAIAIVDNLRMLHMRRAFEKNPDGSHRVLRRTWIYNDELDGDISLKQDLLISAFHDATHYGRIESSAGIRRRLKVSLGIELTE